MTTTITENETDLDDELWLLAGFGQTCRMLSPHPEHEPCGASASFIIYATDADHGITASSTCCASCGLAYMQSASLGLATIGCCGPRAAHRGCPIINVRMESLR